MEDTDGPGEAGEGIYICIPSFFCTPASGTYWPGCRERPLEDWEAAVYRHSLDRLNTINDFLIKKSYLHALPRDILYPYQPMTSYGGQTYTVLRALDQI